MNNLSIVNAYKKRHKACTHIIYYVYYVSQDLGDLLAICINFRLQKEGYAAGLEAGRQAGYCEGYLLGQQHGTELALEVTLPTSHF